jgi:ABC-type antimicrobial peptide transport system permease subunit
MSVVEAIKASPDVLAAGATTGLPLSNAAPYSGVKLPGAQDRAGVGMEFVIPGFFDTIGVPLLEGRLLRWDDLRSDPGAAVLSETAARRMFSGRNPLGQVFVDSGNRQFHVVGVVADVRQRLDAGDLPRAYGVYAGGGILNMVARVRSRNDATLVALKAAVRAVAPESFVTATWWTDSISNITAFRNPRFQTIVLGALGFLALALTALGVFGVVNYLVISRTREMGVRLAVGASPRSLIVFVLKSALTPVLIGIGIGLLATRWISPLAEAQLFEADTRDPYTLALSALVVALATLLGAYLPARRAAAVDPLVALRTE